MDDQQLNRLWVEYVDAAHALDQTKASNLLIQIRYHENKLRIFNAKKKKR